MLDELKKNKSKVQALLSELQADGEGKRVPMDWLTRSDQDCELISLTSMIEKPEEIQTLVQLQEQLCKPSNKPQGKYWTPIQLNSLPADLPSAHSIKTLRKHLTDETLLMFVSSTSGYSFTNEYRFIYQGQMRSQSVRAYDDLVGIVSKALPNLDPAFDSDQIPRYASYILHRASWLSQSYTELLQQAVKDTFPALSVGVERGYAFELLYLYLGRDAQNDVLTAYVRLESAVVFVEGEKKKREEREYKVITYLPLPLSPAPLSVFEEKVQRVAEQRPPPKRVSVERELVEGVRFYLVLEGEDGGEEGGIGGGEGGVEGEEKGADEGEEKGEREEENREAEEAIELDRDWSCSPAPESLFLGELVGWGHNAYYSLALDTPSLPKTNTEEEGEEVFSPRPIPLLKNIYLERVRMVACSGRHSLLLTHFGGVFSCGDNSEGALGVGDLLPRGTFTPVDFPGKGVHIAAGSGVLGSHSMAVDSSLRLYGWGLSKALGRGTIKPTLSPMEIEVKSFVEEGGEESAAGERGQGEGGGEGGGLREVKLKICSVSCGDTFTVCLTSQGEVFTWGQWAHGRLGVGPIPTVSNNSARARSGPKLAKYQLSPMRVLGVRGAVSVACGERHVLCLLRSGAVLAWGGNSLGQLGVGPTRSGLLRDAFSPKLLADFGEGLERLGERGKRGSKRDPLSRFLLKERSEEYERRLKSSSKPLGRKIFCGSFHSACVDHTGTVHTWGARGSPCLGQGDSPLVGDWGGRVNSLFSLSSPETVAAVPYELLGWCTMWAMPRPLEALRGQGVVQMAGGDLSTLFLTDKERIFLAGSGPVVPSFCPLSRLLEEGEEEGEEEGVEGQREKGEEGVEKGREREGAVREEKRRREGKSLPLGVVVSSPRSPSSSWLRELSPRSLRYIASGGGRAFALVGGEVCAAFTHSLYQQLRTPMGGQGDDEGGSVDSSLFSQDRLLSLVGEKTKADCLVICSGFLFFSHQALLAQRSNVLREMILLESPPEGPRGGVGGIGEVVQILLPELDRESAQIFQFFLYHDTFPSGRGFTPSLLHTLSRLGQTLSLPRLYLLSQAILSLLSPSSSSSSSSALPSLDLPPFSLSSQLGGMVGEREYSDVLFLAEGRGLGAHRFLLEERSEYFRALFRSGMSEGAGAGAGAAGEGKRGVEIVVPDSFVGMLRLLIYIYTNTLPDGSDGTLLEDLMAADRYGLEDMKDLCVQMLSPSPSNWLDLLRASDLLHLPALRQQVLTYLRENFQALQGQVDQGDEGEGEIREERRGRSVVEELREEFPDLLEDLLLSRKEYFPAPPSSLLIEQVKRSKIEVAEAERQPFPLYSIGGLLVAVLIYQQVHSVLELGVLVPVINVLATGAFLVYIIRSVF